VVCAADTPHEFVNALTDNLDIICIHPSPRFIEGIWYSCVSLDSVSMLWVWHAVNLTLATLCCECAESPRGAI
jgi:hypothetical protein